MSTTYGHRIVTDGLQLHLDAANIKSYPGTGTAWNDLSGNGNNSTLVHAPTVNSSYCGSLEFDGVNDQAIISSPTPASLVFSEAQNWTYAIFANFYTETSGDAYQAFAGKVSYGPYLNIKSGRLGFRDKTYTENAWYPTMPMNVPYYIVFSITAGTVTPYINKTSLAPKSFDTRIMFEVLAGKSYGGAGNLFKGLASVISIYNKALTQEEVTRNFNALRGRFGI